MKSNQPWYTLFFTNSHLLILSIVVMLVAGFSALTSLPRLEDPRIDTRNVFVITRFAGASAERVEALVTDVIEDELRQLHEVKELKSVSRTGVSVITVELQDWVTKQNNEQIFAKIRDEVADAQTRFPEGVSAPELDEKRAATSFTLLLALTPKHNNTSAFPIVSRLATELSDELRNVSGTELVRVYGDVEEEVNVLIDAQQLSQAGMTLTQASQLIAAADPKSPAGTFRSEQQNLRLQVASELDSLDVIRDIPLVASSNLNLLRLGDISQITRGWRTPVSDLALMNGEQTVFVAARMQDNVRVDLWADAAKKVVADFESRFSGDVKVDIAFDQSEYTAQRLSELTKNMLLGCAVVMAVIFLFMGWRAAWIVGLALPLSSAFALFSLNFFDEKIHQMSIFGIIIAIGLLIDNAIVVTDEIRINLSNRALSRLDALKQSISHLFPPLFSSTLTTVLGFMPILLLSGNIGDFIGSIAVSVVMALIGSLFISLTLIAALAARFLPREQTQNNDEVSAQPWFKTGIQMPSIGQWFSGALKLFIKKPLLPLVVCVVLPVAGFVLSGQLANVFFPSADRDQFQLYLWMPSGTAIEHTTKIAQEMDAMIRAHDGVKEVSWLVGGSFPSVYYNQVMRRDNTPHYANAVITAVDVHTASELVKDLQDQLDQAFEEAQVMVLSFGQGPPIPAPVGFDIYGPDLDELNRLGENVRLAMSQVPGITQTTASVKIGEPELTFDVSREEGRVANLTLVDISRQLEVALEGRTGGAILEATEEVPIRVRLSTSGREELGALSALPLLDSEQLGENNRRPLSALGQFELLPKVETITRTNGVRVNHIEGYLYPGVPAIDVSNAVQQQLINSGFEVPPGYRFKLAGDADEQNEAIGKLVTYLPILLVLMITTLILTFSSFRYAALIGSVAVLSVGLGLFSLWLSGLPLGFNPILGSAGLIGVAINGSIVVIAAINANELARRGDITEIVKETLGCSRHILSTTVTTVGGLIPLLLFSEGTFWPPLAVVLAGGVGFSVILSLIYTPVIARLIGIRKHSRSLDQEQAA